jgi:hypothetical protein
MTGLTVVPATAAALQQETPPMTDEDAHKVLIDLKSGLDRLVGIARDVGPGAIGTVIISYGASLLSHHVDDQTAVKELRRVADMIDCGDGLPPVGPFNTSVS